MRSSPCRRALLPHAAGAIALLLATNAAATGGVGGKGDTGGKGGAGPPSSTEGTTSDTSTTAGTDNLQQPLGSQQRDFSEKTPQEKPWEVIADFEMHRLLQSNYLAEGTGMVKMFNVLDVSGFYYINGPDDRIRLEAAAFQYFLADSGESGFRMDDVELEYSHLFHLPWKVLFRTSAGLTAPLSFDSQLASNITSPFARLKLIRIFGDLIVAAGLSARDYIDRYSSSASLGTTGQDSGSGQPNLHWRFGASLSAEYGLPFERHLSVGASVVDYYLVYYGVGSCPYDTMCYGAVSDPQFGSSQPVQQSYGEDVYVRYILPDLSGFHSNIVLTLANGDPTLGYPTVLNDGIQHPYFLYYNTAEVYLALEGAY